MAENTKNLGLKKPTQEDFYNVDDFNENFQKIDDFAGVCEPFTINLTLTGDLFSSSANMTSDKTYEKIKKAHQSNKKIIVKLYYQLIDEFNNIPMHYTFYNYFITDNPESFSFEFVILNYKFSYSLLSDNVWTKQAIEMVQHDEFSNHKSNTSNPHGVTAKQVGLGNVPNVSTNDQTPTYTEASSLTKLTSGEKISIALGKIAKAITDLISHIGNTTAHITSSERNTWNSKANASHTHSKSEVGLSNVPNVSTNDQTPTHTMASTLATLTSGEKISVAFGKIAKAINDLISHISNTSNPHSVNKSQVGLGSVDNTSDADKPISTAQATAIADAKKAGTDAQSSVSNHIADKSNPHGVTPSQIGAVACTTDMTFSVDSNGILTITY